MAAGDVKIAYAASSNLTVTNLHSLAASATYLSGWGSATIDNSSNLYEDFLITGKLVTHASNRQAGTIEVRVVAELDDSNYPDILSSGTEGTEGAITFTDTEERVVAKLAASIDVDDTASATYGFVFNVANIFGGVCPRKFFLTICGDAATSTNAQFASSGSQVTTKGIYRTIAQ